MTDALRLYLPSLAYPARLMLAILLLNSFFYSTGSALAVEDGTSEVAALRSVIIGQIEAFRNGDAEDAYEFSTPKIKSMFPTPEIISSLSPLSRLHSALWRVYT